MGTYVELEGVEGGKLEGPFFNSISGALKALRTNRICSTAGDHGAVTVWIDDDGAYRCAFTRHLAVIDQAIVKTKVQVKAWLTDWLLKCDEPS